MPFAPTPMKNVSDDEKIAPAEAVPRSGAKRNEEYKRKTGRAMMRGGLLGFEKKEWEWVGEGEWVYKKSRQRGRDKNKKK